MAKSALLDIVRPLEREGGQKRFILAAANTALSFTAPPSPLLLLVNSWWLLEGLQILYSATFQETNTAILYVDLLRADALKRLKRGGCVNTQ